MIPIRTILSLGALAIGVCSADAGQAASNGGIGVELNKLETAGDACRAYLVLTNRSGKAFTSLKLDLVMFDGDGIVQRRVAVETAPVAVGKTSLKVFDIPGTACSAIGRVLLNGVMSCADANGARDDCLSLVTVASRAQQPLIK